MPSPSPGGAGGRAAGGSPTSAGPRPTSGTSPTSSPGVPSGRPPTARPRPGPRGSAVEVSVTVNGELVTRDVEARMLLVHFLRDELGLTGTHGGCDTTNCGARIVLYDGEPVKSCTVLAPMAEGHDVETVEHLEVDGVLDPVQQGFMECHGLQCGFCTPGMLLTARALLDRDPDPDGQEIRHPTTGQICRCPGSATIVRSIRWAAQHPDGLVVPEEVS